MALAVAGNVVGMEVGAGQAFLAVQAGAGADPSIALYRMTSGGGSFTVLGGVGLAHSATARLTFDGRIGYLSAQSPAAGVAVTLDGGTTWSHRDLPCPPGRDAAVRVAASGGGLQVVCSAANSSGQFAKSLFFSSDAAVTFHADTAADPPAEGQLDDLAATGSGSLVMATASSGPSLVRLGGESWTTVARPNTGGARWHDVGFTTMTQGVAVLGGQPGPADDGAGLYLTRDGGLDWARVDFAVPALPAQCSATQLTLTQPADGGGVGLGNVTTPLVFTNQAPRPCSLDGYPGVTLTDASGRDLSNHISRSASSYLLQHADIEPVVLAGGGGTAGFFLSYGDNPVGTATSCPAAVRARVYPPNETRTVSGQVNIRPCANIEVSPVVAHARLG